MVVPDHFDTSDEAKSVQLDLIRQMTPSLRLEKALALSCEVIRLSKPAIRGRHPEFSEHEVGLKLIELNYGREMAEAVRAWRLGDGD